MRDPRGGKRRRVSDVEVVDQDGDTAMQDGNGQDIPSEPADADPANDAQEPQSPLSSKSTRRRSTTGARRSGEHGVADGQDDTVETPSRTGVRSSGRQRKAPQRYEDTSTGQQSQKRSSDTTPGRNGTTPRSTRRTRQVSETMESDEDDEPSPPPQKLTRTRSKKSTVRFDSAKNDTDGHVSQASPSPEDKDDGLDDLVAMQLQNDLAQPDLDTAEEAAPPIDPLPDYAEKLQALYNTGLTGELQTLTRLVLDKLNGKRPVPLKGVESEYQKVYQLVEQTVSSGEGNSMLLFGSRGSGKTTMVETAISSLKTEHTSDFHVIHLNGFLHTDDRLALREMWRQLGRETNTEDEAEKVSSYADTMATLLALLSHPEELYGPPGDGKAVTAAKSVVILLDEFDLFVSHPRQTLLYNLFDIAQARKAPIAVIGLTTKVDVTEMLEKRVKSRFSHRYVYVPLPRSLEMFSEICFAGLNLGDGELPGLVDNVDAQDLAVMKSKGWSRLLDGWRSYLQGLWSDAAFQYHLRRIYNQTKSVKEFFTSALITMADLHYSTYDSTDNNNNSGFSIPIPTPASFTSQTLSCPDPAPLPFSTENTASASPSSLPLSLLLAATRLTALYDPGLETAQPQSLALSFPAAYAEYVRLLTSAKTSASVSGAKATPGRVWGRGVAREAWEKLVSWGLISSVGGGSGTADGRMFRVEISFEEVVDLAGSGGSLGKWWRDG